MQMRHQIVRFGRATAKALRPDRTDEVLTALGSLQCDLQKLNKPQNLNEAEFKVFSQFGEDGAIQFLLSRVKIPDTTFVEIGVESYRESNTRFLASHSNWRGLAIDGTRAHIDFLAETQLGWRADVRGIEAFITSENINSILERNGYAGDIGLMSIDVDGMDYWLLKALDVVRPTILIVEFNSIFGPELKVTVPYSPSFVCGNAHWSHQYFGASLAALEHLAATKGFALVGASKNAVNAFFVRRDQLANLPVVTSAEAWRPSRFLSSRDREGNLSYVREPIDRLKLIRGLPLLDVSTGQQRLIGDLYGI